MKGTREIKKKKVHGKIETWMIWKLRDMKKRITRSTIHITEDWGRQNKKSQGETIFRDYNWEFFRIDKYWESLDSRGILNPKQDCGETTDHQRKKKDKKIKVIREKNHIYLYMNDRLTLTIPHNGHQKAMK